MDVGSEECPFNGNLEIILKGIKGSYNIQGMGEKFIGVGSGGTLEIHGARKTSWTKLSQTIPKTLDSDYIFKHSVDGDQSYNWVQGVNMYTFNPTNSSDFTYKAYYLSGNPGQDWWNNKGRTEFIADVQNITTGHFVMMSVLYTMKHPSSTTDMSTVYNAMETAFFGSVTGQSIFRTLQHRDAYVLFASKGDTSSAEEIVTRENTAKQSQTADFSFTDWANDVKYYVKSHVDNVNTWAAKTEYTLTPTNIAYPVINVIDDLENWNEGDTVFCTSTDYNMEQAERARIVACPTCTSKQFRVEMSRRGPSVYDDLCDDVLFVVCLSMVFL
ncbi:hypothetical protein FSP39_005501 [Pinctada imbricata]|uniref:G8 domain-containing protein n=1 Tax=Pinctada imbricata TaxID=66713 RepID=A0AA88XRU0_PINIB|nr:hypothetical protein FSP39_005501 [Pinctada imbricata]